MTAKQVYKAVGGRYGKEAFDTILERIRIGSNLKILATDESKDEETGKHSHAMVLFGYDNLPKKVEKAADDFNEAFATVAQFLKLFDLGLEYECNGDGDGCILLSYRIV